MDARIKNQIGQPAASTIANTRILQMCLNYGTSEQALHDEGFAERFRGRNCSVSH
jgi:hypothetical protein